MKTDQNFIFHISSLACDLLTCPIVKISHAATTNKKVPAVEISTGAPPSSRSLREILTRCKPIDAFVGEKDAACTDSTAPHLQRSIGLFQLVMLGVGATVGTGIFVALTAAVPEAGPAVLLSFLIAGITAALTALCYAELVSTINVCGSSYSYAYAYATLGELAAFIVGSCLLLERVMN